MVQKGLGREPLEDVGAMHHIEEYCACPRQYLRCASSSQRPACLLHVHPALGAHSCLRSERCGQQHVIEARSFREALEMLFRFAQKRASITVEGANPAQNPAWRGRVSVCPSTTTGENPEMLLFQPPFFQCLEGTGLHPSHEAL